MTTVCLAALLGFAVALVSPSAAVAQTEKPPDETKPEVDDLGERLKRKAVTDSDEDLMSEIIRLMNEASKRLAMELDAGDDTQAMQSAIVEKIDEAIQYAAQNRRRSTPKRPQSSSDKRIMPKKTDPSKGAPADETGKAHDASSGETVDSGGTAGETARGSGAMEESRRSWGNLPLREREEVIQGSGEVHLERYRKLIERYYRALQELEQTP